MDAHSFISPLLYVMFIDFLSGNQIVHVFCIDHCVQGYTPNLRVVCDYNHLFGCTDHAAFRWD